MPIYTVRFLLITLFLVLPAAASAQIAVNEIMASNSETIADEDGDFEDWIEIYNYSDTPVFLEGYGLSDDYDNPFRWTFPAVTIQPGQYLLVWASNKDRRDPGQPLHTNFAISSAGEEILLTAPNGLLLDEIEPTPIPTDVSLGRYPNGTGELFFFNNPTPEAPNQDDGYQDILEKPVFSILPGFYSNSQQLEITSSTDGAVIYYTTDGSEPTTSSSIYDGAITLEAKSGEPNTHSMIRTNPIEADNFERGWIAPVVQLEKAHTIRAKAVKSGYLNSDINSGTWFIDVAERNMPVISLTTDLDNLFDDDIGIYVPGTIYNENGYGQNIWGDPYANYFQRGREWERPATIEWFEHGQQVFRQDVGVRIHGGGTRSLPMKSLRLYARGSYGQTHFEYPVFEDQDYFSYKRLLLRNSGQDFYHRASMFRDAFMQSLVGNLQFDTQAYRPMILFINGEYWGIHNLRERYDKHYFERKYQVEEEYLDYLTGRFEVKEGSNEHYLEMIDFLENNSLTDPDNYEYIQTQMDVVNYIDYVIANVFVRNNDWPSNNIDFWRYNGPIDPETPEKDGRWRWILFDTDFGFGLNGENQEWEFDMLDLITDDEIPWSTLIIRSLFENDTFTEKFITRFSDLLNSTFQVHRITELINSFKHQIEPEISIHIDRWNYPENFSVWETNVQNMITFGEMRPQYQWMHLQDHFELDDPVSVTIESSHANAGSVKLNTIRIDHMLDGLQDPGQVFPWEGTYFPGIPLQLSADAIAGFEFAHWLVDGEQIHTETLEITPEAGQSLVIIAVFEDDDAFEEAFPQAFIMTQDEGYSFSHWASDAPSGSFPENMAFVYFDERDPGINAVIEGFTSGEYNLDNRTRIIGLDDDGFAFINTGNEDGNPGYPGTKLGGALLALDTRDISEAKVEFTAGTVLPNSREYFLRLQYRIGDEGPFHDVTHPDGTPVEYRRNEEAGHSETIGPVQLPQYLTGLPYVQLLWRYYHTGIRYDEDSGQRTKIRIGEINVKAGEASGSPGNGDSPQEITLYQNYPNPFNPETTIQFSISDQMQVNVSIYDITGRLIQTLADRVFSAGTHRLSFHAGALSSGVYLYVLDTGNYRDTRKMLLVR